MDKPVGQWLSNQRRPGVLDGRADRVEALEEIDLGRKGAAGRRAAGAGRASAFDLGVAALALYRELAWPSSRVALLGDAACGATSRAFCALQSEMRWRPDCAGRHRSNLASMR
ncbi:helicase associated domain-containing protein [Streptomyces sp. SP17BM10]|uniref:helicase associated domain-containing protein n=1 Tax=Streptomyces sp. SP17BM10 TaxID=3002530 RepID=UPI002E777B39|nr:helicase associated domain-containing protein [Streptomyces sp. SP17BM10]MEE1782769.1 helicase associated domain-containing protein [Streptomyces sp. SP17BM10]